MPEKVAIISIVLVALLATTIVMGIIYFDNVKQFVSHPVVESCMIWNSIGLKKGDACCSQLVRNQICDKKYALKDLACGWKLATFKTECYK